MSVHDFRTKPETEWTFYVVDNLPTMSNIYRYDTPQEAIEKFASLPPHQISAIGSSLLNRYEIDHIHKRDGRAVLIRDMERAGNSVWRDSAEIQAAVALMRDKLRVAHELSSMFGSRIGSVAIPITEPDQPRSSYLNDKKLNPKVHDRPLSGINEVFTEGKGWTDILSFLDAMENREWSPETGYPVPFVETLNIRYVDNRGHWGQADVSPADFLHLKNEYELGQQKKAPLTEKIADADAKQPVRAGDGRTKAAPEQEH